MQKYSDYEECVYRYLKRYNEFRAQSDEMSLIVEELKEQKKIYTDAPIADYEGLPKGGGDDKATAVFLAIKAIDDDIERAMQNKKSIDSMLMRVDTALNTLDSTAKKIITEKLINGRRVAELEGSVFMSGRHCRRIINKSIEKMARVIFCRATDRLDFHFL